MIEAMFSDSDLTRRFENFEEDAETILIGILKYAGEYFIKQAREFQGFVDHTNNLRSSIGYVITLNGKMLTEDFEKTGDGTGSGAEGMAKGGRLAQDIASVHTNGLALVGVAGMEYAVYVEAMEGKEVISGACLRTEMWLREAINKAFDEHG